MNSATQYNCAPSYRAPQLFVEQTLAIIKPDVVHKAIEIEDIILKSGFTITKARAHCMPM